MDNRAMILNILVAGGPSIGKTSLLIRVVQDRFEEKLDVLRIGHDFYTKD
jgi:Ni2+-binding GTPase involved in maturation of urease and hydrogenase